MMTHAEKQVTAVLRAGHSVRAQSVRRPTPGWRAIPGESRRSWIREPRALALLLPILAGCAGGAFQARPDDIPRLEQQAAQAPASDAAVQLGQAYMIAGRHEDAEQVLRTAIDAGAIDGLAHLYLGLAHEEQKEWGDARSAYERYLAVGSDTNVRSQLRARLGLVARAELKEQAKLALEREQILSQEAPTPNTLAVMPLQISGVSEELRPLQSALADMMVTDLSVTPAVKPVERVRLQALLDEMLLGQAGFTEGVTNRAGRLLKAENVVQGAITMTGEQQIRIDGDVLLTEQRSSRGTVSGEQSLEAIFDLEKQIVFQIYDRLGVTLTAQERERINGNRTSNLIAFIAYGRGLEALDRGNYTEARAHFGEASRIDPGFSQARIQRNEAAQMQQAASVSTLEIASSATGTNSAVPPTMASGNLLRLTASEVNFSPGDGLLSQGAPAEGTTAQNSSGGAGAKESLAQNSGKSVINISIRR